MMTSASASVCRAVWTMRRLSILGDSWIPGVSTKIICASVSLRIPITLRRVVCGLGVTIATLCPTMRFTRVDFPTLERPPRTTNPARCCFSGSAFTNFLLDLTHRSARGGLLALFLAATLANAQLLARDSDSSGESFRMIGPACRNQLVNRLRAIAAIGNFLELGLVIALDGRPADVIDEQ